MKTTLQIWMAASLAALVWGTACGTSDSGAAGTGPDTSETDTGAVDSGAEDTGDDDVDTGEDADDDVVPGCLPGSSITETYVCPSGQEVVVGCVCVDGVNYECADPICGVTLECATDDDCADGTYCDPCGTSSCPDCDDCVNACVAHGCPSESEALCDMIPPICQSVEERWTASPIVRVIQGGCWACVDIDSCEPAAPSCEEVGGFCGDADGWCPADAMPYGSLTCDDGTPCCVGGLEPGDACAEAWGHCMPSDDSGRPLGCENGFLPIRTTCADGVSTCCAPITDCDDGSSVDCWGTPPYCDEPQIPALIDGCWECVDPLTCEPPSWGPALCEGSSACVEEEWCNPCGTSSCPDCDDCVPACTPHECATFGDLSCRMMRPDCDAGQVSVIIDGCWECVSLATCELPAPTCDDVGGFCGISDVGCPADTTPYDGVSCDDGSPCCVSDPGPALCEDVGGTCVGGVGGCPDGTHATTDGMCMILGDCCVPDAEPSACDLAYGHCMDDTGMCEPGFEPIRTTCDTGATCCAPVSTCNDGSTLRCDDEVPFCDAGSLPAIQDGCWTCVNSVTCLDWGTPECRNGGDCDRGETCDLCATSSCPMCDDCVAACVPR